MEDGEIGHICGMKMAAINILKHKLNLLPFFFLLVLFNNCEEEESNPIGDIRATLNVTVTIIKTWTMGDAEAKYKIYTRDYYDYGGDFRLVSELTITVPRQGSKSWSGTLKAGDLVKVDRVAPGDVKQVGGVQHVSESNPNITFTDNW